LGCIEAANLLTCTKDRGFSANVQTLVHPPPVHTSDSNVTSER